MKINVNKYRGIHEGKSKSNYPYAMTTCKMVHRKKGFRKSCEKFSVWCSAVVKGGDGRQEWIRKGTDRRTENTVLPLKRPCVFML